MIKKQTTRFLVVDLDGTLIKSDTLWESLFLLARSSPLMLLRLPGLLTRGRANLKRKIAELARPDAAILPYPLRRSPPILSGDECAFCKMNGVIQLGKFP